MVIVNLQVQRSYDQRSLLVDDKPFEETDFSEGYADGLVDPNPKEE